MTAIRLDVTRAVGACVVDGYEISHSSEDGVELRTPLADAWAVPFEAGPPVRRFTARKGQHHLSGLWWSATMGRHVGYESWLEHDHVRLLDFDASVVGIASQPFWLYWRDDESRKTVSHAPDFLARHETAPRW